MHPSIFFTALTLISATFTTAAPINRRALSLRSYNQMSISSGVGGSAEARAKAIWSQGLNLSNLAEISDADLAILKVERSNAESAETEAFNPAISAASGAEKEALQVGKIANKVLKLTGLSQVRQIAIAKKEAKGQTVSASERAALQDSLTKLAKNIETDKKNAGKTSKAVSFVGQTSVKL
ncbi:hypothetical protein TWF225_007396 [Orbilia oligospora]|nr:hypothetical protein TWF751_002519 [Orbilia oligospora]KAF3180234.1 hypothetical protein TWF225_007396 [Orbilia oligospora]KAF3248966.1 hypothetical protein TWF217_008947 [Orbilia oligospora]KAF3262151.1 hypothetical protein TWF128_002821 [Orbilia oligospora]KAF3290698.1 hypothetical protein TWF132_006774 [Orbilia oligospora]